MIVIEHKQGHIIFRPEGSEDFNRLANIFHSKEFEEKIKFNGRVWGIEDKDRETLRGMNKIFIPLKNYLLFDPSFKIWQNNEKEQIVPTVIMVGAVESRILKGSQIIDHTAIEDATKYFWKPAVRSPRFANNGGNWDGYIKLYKRWERSFPSGLLSNVEKALKKQEIKYVIQYMYDRNPPKEFEWIVNDGIIPDQDQEEAIEACLSGKRGICKAPTAFGKTAVLAKRVMAGFGVPMLFVANKKSLLDDAAEAFTTGVKNISVDDVAQIKDGYFGKTKLPSDNIEPITAPIVVATIQSLSARLKDPLTKDLLEDWMKNTCKLVIADECQAVGTKTWDEVLNACNAPYRIFLSATPRRTDGASLKLTAGSGPILFDTSAKTQIDKGRLCELDIYYQPFDHGLYNQNDSELQYQQAYSAFIMNNEERNTKCIVDPTLKMVEEGRHVLVLIQYIDHGHLLKELFIKAGIEPSDIRFIWGDTPDKIRTNAVSEFKKGDFKIMIGSTIFDAGVNIPIISGVVLGGAGNSDITIVQRIGRGARNCDYGDILGYLPEFMQKNHGRKITLVYDIIDINTKFFHTQSKNRYYNTISEFGKDRVHIIDGDISLFTPIKKDTARLINQLDKTAVNKMIEEFGR